MTDRQDIDALLIGSLYGELSSTEEARLAAHLESHPQDRTALDNLTRAREAVRESRILQVQFEPPQQISALLLQEAHRRAPKPQEERSWFQRFMRSFMLHPAMAAAAMLVLVVGIAGTVYMKKGDQFAHQTKSEESLDRMAAQPQGPQGAQEPADPAIAGGFAAADAGAPTTNEQYQVTLGDETTGSGTAGLGLDKRGDRVAEDKNGKPDAPAKQKRRDEQLAFEGAKEAKDTKPTEKATVANKPERNATTKKPASKSYLEVTTPDQTPKDFDAKSEDLASTPGRSRTTTGTAGAGGAAPPAVAQQPTMPAPAPAAPPPPPRDEPKSDPVLAWAKEQHTRVTAQVKAGNCDAAATIAVQIANRAPAYYTANIEDDIALKTCKQYIAQRRERDEAERVQRAKATQRRANEPSKATTTDSK